MIIDHIAIAVNSLEDSIRQWSDLFGYRQISPIVTNASQQVRVAFLAKDQSVLVKLVQPSDTDTPLAHAVRRGGGLHHLCFRCESLETAIPFLRQAGARVMVPPEPGEAFCGHKIAFLLAPGNLSIELIDTGEKVLLAPFDRATGLQK